MIKKENKGNFVLTLKDGDVFAADNLKITAQGTEIRNKGLHIGTIEASRIETIFKVEGKNLPACEIAEANKVGAAILYLEKIIEAYVKQKGLSPKSLKEQSFCTIFGATSLTLTTIPNRTSDDVGVIGEKELVGFINSQNTKLRGMNIE